MARGFGFVGVANERRHTPCISSSVDAATESKNKSEPGTGFGTAVLVPWISDFFHKSPSHPCAGQGARPMEYSLYFEVAQRRHARGGPANYGRHYCSRGLARSLNSRRSHLARRRTLRALHIVAALAVQGAVSSCGLLFPLDDLASSTPLDTRESPKAGGAAEPGQSSRTAQAGVSDQPASGADTGVPGMSVGSDGTSGGTSGMAASAAGVSGAAPGMGNSSDDPRCLGDGDCDRSGYCLSGRCVPDGVNGEDCSRAAMCVSGNCSGGLCCSSGQCCRNKSECRPGPQSCVDRSTCTGTRIEQECRSNRCQDGATVPDTSACDGMEPFSCEDGFRPGVCQTGYAPPCPTSCASDEDCDQDRSYTCNGRTCIQPAAE